VAVEVYVGGLALPTLLCTTHAEEWWVLVLALEVVVLELQVNMLDQ
jgi:hypothetical protein